MYIYIYIHVYIHTHTHAHTHVPFPAVERIIDQKRIFNTDQFNVNI